jgi:hypothetical protein
MQKQLYAPPTPPRPPTMGTTTMATAQSAPLSFFFSVFFYIFRTCRNPPEKERNRRDMCVCVVPSLSLSWK